MSQIAKMAMGAASQGVVRQVAGKGTPFGAFPVQNAQRLNAVLSEEEWKVIEPNIQRAARTAMVGRKLFGSDVLGPLGLGKRRYDFDTMGELREAVSSFAFEDIAKDVYDKTETSVKMVIHQLDWTAKRLDIEAARASGRSLDSAIAEAAAYKVGLAENATILNGLTWDGTNYEVNGLYQGAGNSEATSLDWGTVANIITSINNTRALLKADNFLEPFNLVVNPTQGSQADPLVANTASSYKEWIQRIIKGEVIETSVQTAGTGMMVATPGRGWGKFLLGHDLDTWVVPMGPQGDLWGKTFCISSVALYDPNAVSQMTTI